MQLPAAEKPHALDPAYLDFICPGPDTYLQ